MIKSIYKNLDKFKFIKTCSDIYNFKYNDVMIRVVNGSIGTYYSLFYSDNKIILNKFERLMFKIAVRKLIKINNIKNKKSIIKVLEN